MNFLNSSRAKLTERPTSIGKSTVKARSALPAPSQRMVGPFIVLDQLGPAELDSGEGFDAVAHPHLGVVALTYLVDGKLTHRDDEDRMTTIQSGEVSWVMSGSGLVHSERTPKESRAVGEGFFGIQAWLALPTHLEDASSNVVSFGISDVPRTCARGIEFTLIAGESDGLVSPVPTYSESVFAEIVLTSGARYQVKPRHAQRAIYVMAGEVEIDGQSGTINQGQLLILPPGIEFVLRAPAFHAARIVLIGGESMSEPRYRFWNFVSSSKDRVEHAVNDWRNQRYSLVPGETEYSPLPDEVEEASSLLLDDIA